MRTLAIEKKYAIVKEYVAKNGLFKKKTDNATGVDHFCRLLKRTLHVVGQEH